MARIIITALWITVVSVGSCYLAVFFMLGGSAPTQISNIATGIDYERTRPLSVPIIANGEVAGYIVAQLVFTIRRGDLAGLGVPPHPYILDEAYRRIYSDGQTDFSDLKRLNIDELFEEIRQSVNHRLKRDLVKEILVEELNFIERTPVYVQ